MNIADLKFIFLKKEIWVLTISAAFQRANIYGEEVPEKKRVDFKNFLFEFVEKMVENCYMTVMTDELQHIDNIKKISLASAKYSDILKNEKLNFGVSQKILNLYLKYLWCLDKIPVPPHFPVDRLIQGELEIKNPVSWTQMKDEVEYLKIIEKAKQQLQNLSFQHIAELELHSFKRRNKLNKK